MFRKIPSTTIDRIVAGLASILPSTAGRLSGSQTSAPHAIRRDDIDLYRMAFRGSEPAVISLRANGHLDLLVFDDDGDLVDYDVDHCGFPICVFTPPVMDVYTICVINMAPHDVDYILEAR